MKRLIFLLPLVFGLALWFLPQIAPPAALRYNFGNETGLNEYGEGQHLYNFFGWSEAQPIDTTQIRRSTLDGSMVIPWAFRLGQTLDITVRWCECEPIDEPLTININGDIQPLPDSWGFREDSYRIIYKPTIYERDIYLAWQSPNGFGPAIDWIEVRPVTIDGRKDGTIWAILGLMLIIGLGWQRISLSQLIVWLSLNGIALIIGRMLYQIQAVPWTAFVIIGLGYASVLTWFIRQPIARYSLWACGIWLMASGQILGTWVLDDAFISYRYSRNLIQGYGLTFNPGGEIVEGYTNFLWTIQMAGMLALGYEPLVAAHIWTLVFGLACLVVVYRFGRELWTWQWALLAPLLLTVNPHFILYSARGSGMETAQVTLLTILALWLIYRIDSWKSAAWAGIACGVLTMARPDGAIVPLAAGIWLVMRWLGRANKRQWLLTIMGLCAGFAIVYGPYFAWRMSYYGYFLPNTFYAKTGFTSAQMQRGWQYSLDFMTLLGLRSLLALLLLSSIATLVFMRKSSKQAISNSLFLLLIGITELYVIVVGGDHFPNGRFFISILPVLILSIVYGIWAFWQWHSNPLIQWSARGIGIGLLMVFIVRNLQQYPASDSRLPGRPIWGENSVALKNREVGYWLNANTDQGTVIATGIAGTLPYYSQRTVIDALGLNDLHIAHLQIETMGQGDAGSEKTDPNYILDLKPEIIPFSTSGDFQQIPAFIDNYELITVAGPEGRGIKLYIRKDWQR